MYSSGLYPQIYVDLKLTCWQVGGNDQFGNITAGIDLIGRLTEAPPTNENIAYGITVPLLTTASGEKLGKSMGNSVYINGSPYELYQFFAKAEDASAETYLRVLTLLPIQEIKAVMERHNQRPEDRVAQKTLAREVVHMLHGEETAIKAEVQSAVLFGKGSDAGSTSIADAILQSFDKNDIVKIKRENVVGELLAKVMKTAAGMSRGQANSILKAGGVYVGPGGKHRISEELAQVDPGWLVEDRLLLLRIGKSKMVVIEVVA
jgi:tyrosyl-tRNA synthetase